MSLSIDTTFGALLLGGFCAAALSGMVVVQTFLYIKLFPRDSAGVKAIVGAVFTLDVMHSLLVYISIWISLITNYGNETKLDTIPIPLALTGFVTAILTLIVHCFFSYRIHKLSRQQWRFTALILVLAFFRLCCATATTTEMIRMKTFTAFKAEFRWILTLGLAMSTLVDILITCFLTYFLQTLQGELMMSTSRSMDRVVSAVVLYTFQTNLLTSTASTLSMICWLTMPNNMVFLAFHFVIGKLYANSLLATLNARQQLQYRRRSDNPMAVPSVLRTLSVPPKTTDESPSQDEVFIPDKVYITAATVARAIECVADDFSPSKNVKHAQP